MIEPGRRVRPKIRVLPVLLLLGACAEPPPPPEAVIRPVRYLKLEAADNARVRSFAGTAQAGAESRLSFKVSGTVRTVKVKVGDKIKAKALIATLDPSDYQLQVQEAQAALAQARAQARNASTAYKRVKSLYANRTVSAQELDGARAQHESAKAAVRSIQKRLQLARQQVRYTELRAPAEGAIASVQVNANENVKAGQPVVLLTSGKKPEVSVAVPEALIAKVQKGAKVKVKFDALPEAIIDATVAEVGVAAQQGATFPVTVTLDTLPEALRPGMAAEVSFDFGEAAAKGPPRFRVPPFAVGEDRKGRHVFVVKPAEAGFGTVERRGVEVGELSADGFEVKTGLKAGELLVTAGVTKLEDGRKVRLPELAGK